MVLSFSAGEICRTRFPRRERQYHRARYTLPSLRSESCDSFFCLIVPDKDLSLKVTIRLPLYQIMSVIHRRYTTIASAATLGICDISRQIDQATILADLVSQQRNLVAGKMTNLPLHSHSGSLKGHNWRVDLFF